jgi:hypothetical protein
MDGWMVWREAPATAGPDIISIRIHQALFNYPSFFSQEGFITPPVVAVIIEFEYESKEWGGSEGGGASKQAKRFLANRDHVLSCTVINRAAAAAA